MKSSQPAAVRNLATLVVALAFAAHLHAAVTNVAWYRLGENDAGAGSGGSVNAMTTDLIGSNHLKQYNGPVYINTSTADNTLRRKTGNMVADTNPADAYNPAINFDGYPIDTT